MMKRLIAATASLGALAALLAPASTASATSSQALYSTSGASVVRAKFYEHANFSGAILTVYGTGNCTSTTSDADYSRPSMPTGWNDVVSSWRDYAGCDVKLYENISYGGRYTYYIDAGSTGHHLDGTWWNDKTSSFRLS